VEGLFRVVRTEAGTLAVGRSLPGRGAWLCRSSPGCIDRAAGRHAFSRALRGEVTGSAVEGLVAEMPAPAMAGEGPNGGGPSPMCENGGSYVRIGTYAVKEGQ
jgi:predicted RNA-binding protein YlxR (DUF448 family)